MSIPIVGSFLRSIHLDARKVMSEADLPMVGIMDVTTAERRVPVRLFYPSSAKEEGNVGSFVRGFDYFIDGYLHTLLPWFRDNALVLWLITWISYALSWLAPMGHASLPSCAYGAPPVSSKGQKYPLIIFSHGLTGTGEEHALTFAYWAQRGYVVASVHHCDGSSSKVPRPGDAHLLYEHPDLLNYDPDFRPRQIEIREEELFEGLQYILQQSSPIRDIIDEKVVIVGGFSYGAATACLSVAKRKGVFVACYLLDGWFYIDLGGGTTFPAEAHEKGLDVPALFIGSEHFANWKSCASATAELSKKNSHPCGSSCHVIPGSRHQNFTDVGFWLSTWVLRKVNMIGPCDYLHQYQNVLKISTAFFNLHTKKPM